MEKEGMFRMKSVNIRLTMMTDHVRNFVSLVNRYPYDMDLRSGRYVVDAKSILGIFSIDLSRPIRLDIYSDDCDDLIEALDGYLIKEDQA
jgi:phosphotransferase system HPr-like phosphotransfer protein